VVPRLAAWSLAAGIVAAIGANLAHGVGHGPIGVLVSAWPAVALVGSFELLMLLIYSELDTSGRRSACCAGRNRDHSYPHKATVGSVSDISLRYADLTPSQSARFSWTGGAGLALTRRLGDELSDHGLLRTSTCLLLLAKRMKRTER
jgi:hypothetical protein